MIIFNFINNLRVFLKDPGSPKESEFWKKNYDPYEQDLFNFPDSNK